MPGRSEKESKDGLSSLISESRFEIQKFKIPILNWTTIEFPIILNLGFSDLEKITCILRRLYIFPLCSFTFVCVFSIASFLFSLARLTPSSRCASLSARTRDEDGCSSSKVSLFEPSNKSLEDVKTTLDLQIGNVSTGTVLVTPCGK